MKIELIKALVVLIVVIVGEIYLTEIIDRRLSVDPAKMIFNIPQIEEKMVQHQRDARYLPYRLRIIVFNQSIYLWQMGRNMANFVNLNNINQTILLANIYPIFWGIRQVIKRKNSWWWLLGIMGGFMVIGLNKMVDARAATWMWLPVMIYLWSRGIRKVNRKWYGGLMLISLILRA